MSGFPYDLPVECRFCDTELTDVDVNGDGDGMTGICPNPECGGKPAMHSAFGIAKPSPIIQEVPTPEVAAFLQGKEIWTEVDRAYARGLQAEQAAAIAVVDSEIAAQARLIDEDYARALSELDNHELDDLDDPFDGRGYEHTHTSKSDGSPAMLLGEGDGVGLFVNENGDQWEDRLDEWDPIDGVLDKEARVCFNGDMDTNTHTESDVINTLYRRQMDDLELALDLWDDGAADLDHEFLVCIEDAEGERTDNLDAWAKYLGVEFEEEDHHTTWWVKFTSEERTAFALHNIVRDKQTIWHHNPSRTSLAIIDWRLQ